MAYETELKFQVPEPARAAVRRAVATATSKTQVLRAVYFDTADRDLARAGMSLRMRREGRRWVQTLKGPGAGTMDRLEHEVVLGQQRELPALDLERHAGTAVSAALATLQGGDPAALKPVCETRVRRVQRLVRVAGTALEIAFDEGFIVAGDQQQPVCEIEFELRSGPVAGLLSVASRWVQRFGLWLDVRSKFQRGELLSQGRVCAPATLASAPVLNEAMDPDTALRCMVRCLLAQVLPNAAELAAGTASAEHLHQLRVGLRRLRTALRVFGDWSGDTRPGWNMELRALFGLLGLARDRDALAVSILPALEKAGAPWAMLPEGPAQDGATAAMRSVACNRTLLELIGFCVGAPAAGAPGVAPVPLTTRVTPCLRRMHRRLNAEAVAFAGADDAARHRTRKRAKRLRYCLEFVAALYRRRPVKRYLAHLRRAQETLGAFNDGCIAEQVFRLQVAQEPRAWFAVGWLAAQREARISAASAALGQLPPLPKPASSRAKPRQ